MPPSRWDDEEDESSSGSDSPPPQTVAAAGRRKFDDEEDEEDVLDSWDAADDSETERAKAKAADEARQRAEAAAAAAKKPKSQRIEERRMEQMRRRQEELDLEDSDDDEDPATKLARMREMEKEADLKNAADLFGEIGVNPARAAAVKPVVLKVEGAEAAGAAGATVDLASLKLFSPDTRDEFLALRETLAPLVASANNAKKARYPVFAQEFTKALCKDLSSEQIKKVASGLTALANEKMKEEKAAEKGGKKSKAAKTKTTLNASRGVGDRGADVTAYDDDGLDDGDFM